MQVAFKCCSIDNIQAPGFGVNCVTQQRAVVRSSVASLGVDLASPAVSRYRKIEEGAKLIYRTDLFSPRCCNPLAL